MLRLLVSKGEGLDTEDMSLRSSEQFRVAFANTELNNHLMVGMTPEGKIILRAKESLTDINKPLQDLFEGTLEELIARIAQ
jgi:hypothetical protein